jgi:hypothetical protein
MAKEAQVIVAGHEMDDRCELRGTGKLGQRIVVGAVSGTRRGGED